MKAKRTISKQLQQSQAAIKREKPPFHFSHIWEIMPFLGLSQEPSALDCEDLSQIVYRRVQSLLLMFDWAQSGLDANSSDLFPETTQAALDAVRFEVEIGRLAAETLYKLYKQDLGDSKVGE